ncbi:MAG: patatin-like phospholipase family protein, partial [Anaerolineales bacterium]
FYQATQKDLSVVASDITQNMKLVLNHRTAPKVPVVWATRMSMNFPLVWQEVTWQAEWGTYRGADISGDRVVDGGLVSNFPLELFVSDDETVVEVMGPKKHDNVLGLLIDDDIPVPNAPPQPQEKDFLTDLTEFATIQRLWELVDTMTKTNDKAVATDFEELVARLPAGGYTTFEFDMTDERRNALINSGCTAMTTYFDHLSITSFSIGPGAGPTRTEIANKVALKMLK